MNRWDSRRIGLLGGTFDPPHIGHLLLAAVAARELNLDGILFLPVGQPTHKTSMTPASHRVAMTDLAVRDNPLYRVDLTDVNRPPPHYTADLLPRLKSRLGPADLWLLLGGDSLRDFPTWHDPERVISQVPLAVLNRPGAQLDWVDLELRLPGIRRQTRILSGPAISVSSTWLRGQVGRRGGLTGPAVYLLPPAVADYLTVNPIYRTEGEENSNGNPRS